MMCLKSDPDSVYKCAELLKEEKVLILPTDTVYGFSGIVGGTDSKIRKIKGRSETKPFIRLIAEPEDIKTLTADVLPEELTALWPGALTIIVHDMENKTESVAYRCPGDPWLRSVIKMTGAPIYSTSVNRSGSPVIDNINGIRSEFENEVALIVSDGDKKDSLPSTIVKICGGKITVIRQGSVKI